MDEGSHVFLIKDKIRCIQKKIMDQLAADLNSALNDTDILPSSLSHTPMSSVTSATISKIKRRRKRPVNNDMQQQKPEASGSTTPENTQNRNSNTKQSISSDGDDLAIPSKAQSSSLALRSESDSTSQTDDLRRRRRPFKKPIIPSSLASVSTAEQPTKLVRYPSAKVCNTTTAIGASLRRRRRNCRSESNSRIIDIDENPSTPSSASSYSLAVSHTNYTGKRKRSRAIIHDDFRSRNHSLHEYDMACVDEANITNLSSSSSLNLSDSDKEPCLTSNEADDEQSDWPRDESSVPRMISWWEDDDGEEDKSEDEDVDDDDDDDTDEKMLTTTDGTLQKIVSGALSMMVTNSKKTIQNRIKTFVHREMLTGNRRNVGSKNTYTYSHPKRHVRLLKEARRSHHSSYSHKRVKSDHYPHRHNEIVAPIVSTQINNHSWTSGHGHISTSLPVNTRTYRQGLGPENTPMDTSEQIPSSHPSHD